MTTQADPKLADILLGRTGGPGGLNQMLASPMLNMGLGVLSANQQGGDPFAALMAGLQSARTEAERQQFQQALAQLAAQMGGARAPGAPPGPAAGPQMSPVAVPTANQQLAQAGVQAPQAVAGAATNPFAEPPVAEPQQPGAAPAGAQGAPGGFETLITRMMQSQSPRIQQMGLQAMLQFQGQSALAGQEAQLRALYDPATSERVVGVPQRGENGNMHVVVETKNPDGTVTTRTEDTGLEYLADVPAGVQKSMEAATDAAFTGKRQAAKAIEMSGRFGDLAASDTRFKAGVPAKVSEMLKSLTGSEDAVTLLRTQYRELAISDVLNKLPPGVASDKDVSLAMSTILGDTANPELLAEALQTMARVRTYQAVFEGEKAKWLHQNRGIGGFAEYMQQNEMQLFEAAMQRLLGNRPGGAGTPATGGGDVSPGTGGGDVSPGTIITPVQ